MIQWGHLRGLWRQARQLQTGAIGPAKVVGAYCLHRLRARLPSLPRTSYSVAFPCGGRRVTATLRDNETDWKLAAEVFLTGPYKLQADSVHRILDLGANIGLSSLYFASAYPDAQIAAVEPLPSNLRLLAENIQRNSLPVRVFPAAAGVEDGRAQFFVGTLSENSSLVKHDVVTTGTIEVETLRVETILEKMGWESVDLLKIDVEGYERQLFAGSPFWLGRVRAIVGELHDGYGLEQLHRDLSPRGFQCEEAPGREEHQMIAFRAWR